MARMAAPMDSPMPRTTNIARALSVPKKLWCTRVGRTGGEGTRGNVRRIDGGGKWDERWPKQTSLSLQSVFVSLSTGPGQAGILHTRGNALDTNAATLTRTDGNESMTDLSQTESSSCQHRAQDA